MLDEQYWTKRYHDKETGWNVGYITDPIKAYIDQYKNKSHTILIPGAGNSYEAEYIYNAGYKNIHVCDLSSLPLANLKSRIPSIPNEQLIEGNFFDLEIKVDLVIEQTFFCALDPSLRSAYVDKMYQIIKPEGLICGLMFNRFFDRPGPPFGGSIEEYKSLFEQKFDILIMEPCYNSIASRTGNEIFVKMRRKDT